MSSAVEKHIISQETRNTVSMRYKRITRAINNSFWNSDSETANSLYVGSYGRGTAIKTSDLDVLMLLPSEAFGQFTSQTGNGQSRLLQLVKSAILVTYPNSSVKGDGQVVVVNFSDGMKFEILPAFKNDSFLGWDGTYKYPNTHMGGNWLSTNPKCEIDAMKTKDDVSESNHLLTATCQHIRYIRDQNYSSYHVSGILIDSFVYQAIGNWRFLRDGEEHNSGPIRYEEYLLNQYNQMSYNSLVTPLLKAPGSDMPVDATKGWIILGKILNYMA